MIDYYDRVIVADIRESGRMPTTAELMRTYGVTDVLFINNVQAAMSLQDSLRTTPRRYSSAGSSRSGDSGTRCSRGSA